MHVVCVYGSALQRLQFSVFVQWELKLDLGFLNTDVVLINTEGSIKCSKSIIKLYQTLATG